MMDVMQLGSRQLAPTPIGESTRKCFQVTGWLASRERHAHSIASAARPAAIAPAATAIAATHAAAGRLSPVPPIS